MANTKFVYISLKTIGFLRAKHKKREGQYHRLTILIYAQVIYMKNVICFQIGIAESMSADWIDDGQGFVHAEAIVRAKVFIRLVV